MTDNTTDETETNTADAESIDWQATAELWKGRAEAAEGRITELEDQVAALKVGKSVAPGEKKVLDYKSGERVEVVQAGEWTEAYVTNVEKRLGLLYVHSDRFGPLSISSSHAIRPATPKE